MLNYIKYYLLHISYQTLLKPVNYFNFLVYLKYSHEILYYYHSTLHILVTSYHNGISALMDSICRYCATKGELRINRINSLHSSSRQCY